LQSIQAQFDQMVQLFAHNLEITPFVAISELRYQIFDDMLIVGDVFQVESTEFLLLGLSPLENKLIGIYLVPRRLIMVLISLPLLTLDLALHDVAAFNDRFPSLILLIGRDVVVLSEEVQVVEPSDEGLNLSVEEGDLVI